MSLSIALIHHPVVDRHKEIITSSVTNMDLQDLARSCRTYGVHRYFVLHPSPDEQALNQRILKHWNTGYGKNAHPTRTQAVELVSLVYSFEEILKTLETDFGSRPEVIGTSAQERSVKKMLLTEAREKIKESNMLLLFGTGYGLAPSWDAIIEAYLPPIKGPTVYNHLSVRSAVAIYLDRLLGA